MRKNNESFIKDSFDWAGWARSPSTAAASRVFTLTPGDGAPCEQYDGHYGEQET